ncbi:MAG: site-specific integrase [Alphaproteobacteria bacterium]|nr:site-specific integrase [Alphaproteobacteria bacterium]
MSLPLTSEPRPTPRRVLRETRRGYQFRLDHVVWKLSKDSSINWDMCSIAPSHEALRNGYKQALARAAEQLAPGTITNYFSHFNHFWPHCTEGIITSRAINAWRKELGEEGSYRLGHIRGFIQQWRDWGFGGIEENAVLLLDSFSIPGYYSGHPVRIACPYTGPYTRQEYQAIAKWVQSAWREGEISLIEAALLSFFMDTGRRLEEPAKLRACDLQLESCQAAEDQQFSRKRIRLHQAKGRLGLYRDPNRIIDLSISDETYDLLANVARQTRTRLEAHWDFSIPPSLAKDLPVFVVTERMTRYDPPSNAAEAAALIQKTPERYHTTRASLDGIIRCAGQRCDAVSERTGERMLITTHRFRRTLGTVLAQNGYNAYEIAEIMGHATIDYVMVYVENTAEAFDRYEEKMAGTFETLLRSFRGELIERERSDAQNQPYVHSLRGDNQPEEAGRCGSLSQCHRGWYTCYSCVKFRPYVDADHKSALMHVKLEYERTVAMGYQDSMLTGLEATIFAIEEVIRTIDALHEKLHHG